MADEKDDKPDYEVGYQKPPKNTQFRKGQSGNPSGRPKMQKSVSQLTHEVSNRKINVTDGGKQVKMTRIEIMVKQLMQKAMQGDLRAIREVTNILALHAESAIPSEDVTRERSTKEEMMQGFLTMMANMRGEQPLEASEIEDDEEEDECSNVIK